MERTKNDIEQIISKAKEIADLSGVKLWKVYYVGAKLNLDRLPTVEEIKNYKGQVGRPFKGASNASNNNKKR